MGSETFTAAKTRNGALDAVAVGEELPPMPSPLGAGRQGQYLGPPTKIRGKSGGKDGLCTLSLLPPLGFKILHGNVPSLCS